MANPQGLFAKIFCSLMHEDWFQRLSCTYRGIYMQLLVCAKDWGNTGEISVNSLSYLGQVLGCDGKTLGKFLENSDVQPRVVRKNLDGTIYLTIVKYHTYQQTTGVDTTEKSAPTQGNFPLEKRRVEKSRVEKIAPPEKSLDEKPEEETKPKLSNIKRFDEWVAGNQKVIYEMCIEGKYDEAWFRAEFPKMRTWIIGNDQKGNKKNWKAFIANWIISGSEKRKDKSESRSPVMTAEQEDYYYAMKRRSGSTTDFTGMTGALTKISGGEE